MTQRQPSRLEQFRRATVHEHAPALDRRSSRSPAAFIVAGAAAAVSTLAVLYSLFPPDHARDWLVTAALIAGAATAWWMFVRHTFYTVPRRWQVAGSVVVAGLIAVFAVGLTTQLVIDGEPMLATSNAARANDIIGDLYDDIMTLGVYDELLTMEQADARARYNSYEPAAKDLRSIANRWSRVDLGGLPDPALIDVVQHVKVAATFGAEAVEIRYRLITEPDARSEAALLETRGAFFAETIAAGAKLRPLAEQYRVDVVPQGVVE